MNPRCPYCGGGAVVTTFAVICAKCRMAWAHWEFANAWQRSQELAEDIARQDLAKVGA